ncbi:MAG: hypothetical protein AB7F99_01435 [Vicinamibacterales bacterium]
MPSAEREHHLEQEPDAYLRCARFPDAASAGRAYDAVQEAIFASQSDLSCFRFQLNDVWHDAVLGQVPPPEFSLRLDTLLSTGEPTTLPAEVLHHLKTRRAAAVASGLRWIERHRRDPNGG